MDCFDLHQSFNFNFFYLLVFVLFCVSQSINQSINAGYGTDQMVGLSEKHFLDIVEELVIIGYFGYIGYCINNATVKLLNCLLMIQIYLLVVSLLMKYLPMLIYV